MPGQRWRLPPVPQKVGGAAPQGPRRAFGISQAGEWMRHALCALSRGRSLSFVENDGVGRSLWTPLLRSISVDKSPRGVQRTHCPANTWCSDRTLLVPKINRRRVSVSVQDSGERIGELGVSYDNACELCKTGCELLVSPSVTELVLMLYG